MNLLLLYYIIIIPYRYFNFTIKKILRLAFKMFTSGYKILDLVFDFLYLLEMIFNFIT